LSLLLSVSLSNLRRTSGFAGEYSLDRASIKSGRCRPLPLVLAPPPCPLMAQSGHSRHRNILSVIGQERTNSGALLARVIGSRLYNSFQFGRASAPRCPQRWHRSLGPNRHRHIVGITAHVENPMVIAAATEAPSGERPHAVGAHVAEGHGRLALVGGLTRYHAPYATSRVLHIALTTRD